MQDIRAFFAAAYFAAGVILAWLNVAFHAGHPNPLWGADVALFLGSFSAVKRYLAARRRED